MAAMVSHDMLVPTDFGPGSRLALERAIQSLGPEGGTIGVMHVLDQHLIAQRKRNKKVALEHGCEGVRERIVPWH